MPVHLVRRGKEYCVAEPDGTIVPSGCYSKRSDALARLRAINANSEKDNMTVINSNYLDSRSEEERKKDKDIMTDATFTVSDNNTSWVTIDTDSSNVTVPSVQKEENVSKEANEEKMGFFLDVPPTTFAELDEARQAREEEKGIQKIVSDFMALVGNIMSFPSGNKRQSIKDLLEEMKERMPDEEEEPEEEPSKPEEEDEEKSKEVIIAEDEKPLFMIWKDDASGDYRWLGIYSNKFRDDDIPAEILAEKAHLRFIERVEKGELDYPDLYIWHIPVPVGKADLLAYDNAGFSVVSGIIEEDFAHALKGTSEDLAMSHGMPAESIRRDEEDPTIITEYASSEVSVLPRYAAANKMTDFQVLQEEEKAMAIIPDEKRQQVASLLGDELTGKLEEGLAARSEKAVAEGIEFKEESEEVATEPVAEAETEVETEVEAEVEAPVEETVEEPIVEAEDEAVDSVDETADDGAEIIAEEPVMDSANVTKEELAKVLATVVEAIGENTKKTNELIETLTQRLNTVEENVGSLSKSDEERVAELAASTPEASLQALLAKQLTGQATSVIGKSATRVHGNSSLAKDGPQETLQEEGDEANTGLFFQNW